MKSYLVLGSSFLYVRGMIEAFFNFMQYEKRSSVQTIISYRTDLDQYCKYLLFQYECHAPENASSDMLRSWVVSLMEEGLSPSSVNRKIATLRSFYGYLRRKQIITTDPSKLLSSLKMRKKLPLFLEEKAMETLFDTALFADDFEGIRDQCILELFYGTGIRLSELIGLDVSDIDFSGRTIRVFGKNAKERLVPISQGLAQLLTHYLTMRAPIEDTPRLILTDSGKSSYPVFIQRKVKKYLAYITTLQKKSPHVLRHTYATHLLNRGADLNAIKELLGHANLAATQVYTHNSIEKLKKSHEQAHPKA
jgi:integrase/recombinase XerC